MDKLPQNREPLYPAAFQALPLGADQAARLAAEPAARASQWSSRAT